MIGWISEIAACALAAHRITQGVVADDVTGPARVAAINWAIERGPRWYWVEPLVTCGQCAGFWVSIATYAALASTSAPKRSRTGHVISALAVAGAQSHLWARWHKP